MWGIPQFGWVHHKSVNGLSAILFIKSLTYRVTLNVPSLAGRVTNIQPSISPSTTHSQWMYMWRVIHLVFLTTVLGTRAPMAEGCSCERLHPQQHFCSASYGEFQGRFIPSNSKYQMHDCMS